MSTAIEIRNFSFTYAGAEEAALRDISLNVEQGDFILVCGSSGCGKTTLLRNLKQELAPVGTRLGTIRICGRETLSPIESAKLVGFVMQDPDNQIVMDTVWLELAFGLENLAVPSEEIGRRIGEIAAFFGIQDWFGKSVFELSGGQKQILTLASVIAMQADIIILDEPTAQLDPIAAGEFLQMLKRVSSELGKTVLLSEHLLEGVLADCDKVLYLEAGGVAYYDDNRRFADYLSSGTSSFTAALPAPARLSVRYEKEILGSLKGHNDNARKEPPLNARKEPPLSVRKEPPLSARKEPPLNVREGRSWLAALPPGVVGNASPASAGHTEGQGHKGDGSFRVPSARHTEGHTEGHKGDGSFVSHDRGEGFVSQSPMLASGKKPILSAHDIWFRYDRGEGFVLKGLETEILDKEIHMYVGGNGSGKSTLLGVLGGIFKPFKGKIQVPKDKKRCMLFQDPKSVFVCDTLLEDLMEHDPAVSKEDATAMADKLRIGALLHRHPYDLSAGEMQKAAIAKVLLLKPDILLLDEPIKGLDAFAKQEIGGILNELKASGVTIIMVTHDIEFAAEYADRCSMVFGNAIIASGGGREFFRDNMFYTTSISRMTRGLAEGCILEKDVVFERNAK